ncbi:MAG: glycyl-radical enzyme activating protein [bacterium]
MADEAMIFNVQRFSTEDGPGIRTTCFFKGCPLTCTWCHNPEGILMKPQLVWYEARCIGARDCIKVCPKKALELTPKGLVINRDLCDACGLCADACPAAALEIIGKTWTLDALFDEVRRDAAFYETSGGGVTLSGGEPLMQREFVCAFIEKCRAGGLHVALDTTGYAAEEVFLTAAGLADLVLLDLKQMGPDAHRQITGVPLEPILKNAKLLAETGKPLWVRTPVIPGATDSDENIIAVARFIAESLPNCERYDILPFSNLCTSKYDRLGMDFKHRGEPLISQERMEDLKRLAEEQGVKNVVIQGLTVRGK